jgi:hypothetical protein
MFLIYKKLCQIKITPFFLIKKKKVLLKFVIYKGILKIPCDFLNPFSHTHI